MRKLGSMFILCTAVSSAAGGLEATLLEGLTHTSALGSVDVSDLGR